MQLCDLLSAHFDSNYNDKYSVLIYKLNRYDCPGTLYKYIQLLVISQATMLPSVVAVTPCSPHTLPPSPGAGAVISHT